MCRRCCSCYSVCYYDSDVRLLSQGSGLGAKKCLYFLALLLNFVWGWDESVFFFALSRVL